MATATQSGQQEKTREVAREAKDVARTKLDEGQQAAASGLGELAGCLRTAARQVGERNGTVARVAESAAERLEQLSGTLRSKDLDTLVRDTESFARREPMVFLGAAMAAGFIAIRFLKSGRPHETPDQPRRI
jgi:hypothetical protein